MTRFQEACDRADRAWQNLAAGDAPVLRVGAATCGRAAGASDVLQRLRDETVRRDLEARVLEVGCIGLCCAEPVLIADKPGAPSVVYGPVGPDEAAAVLERWILGGDPCPEWALGTMGDGAVKGLAPFAEHPMMKGQVRRVLANCGLIDPEDVEHCLARGGYRGFARAIEGGALATLQEVKTSGLRGRGGAGFPVWRKWQFCREAEGSPKYLICNADEGDPGAFMDRSLLESDPHAALEGMLIAGFVLGASEGYVYCRAEYPLALKRLDVALAQMEDLGLLGQDILGSGWSFRIQVKKGAGAFVCGEETALLASVEGRRGMPRPRPPFPAVQGLWGKPTVIQNVETLGNLPVILREGGEAYRGVGTDESPGTKTFALAGKVRRTGLVEVPMGIALRTIVEEIGGGVPEGRALKAVQTGGPSGGMIPAEKLDLPVDYESLAEVGSIMGSGGMIVLDETTCAVDVARYFLSFTQEESCGKCPPCRVGTRAMLAILEAITEGRAARADLERLESMAWTVKNGSLCGLGQTAPNPVLTTLRYFRNEYLQHIEKHECRAFVCRGLLQYHIDPDRCIRCGACFRVCPVDAVAGSKEAGYAVDPDVCIQCGMCLRTCPPTASAVYRTSGARTRYEPQTEKEAVT